MSAVDGRSARRAAVAARVLARVATAPTVHLGRWPTAVTVGESSAGPVLIKRDDQSGYGRGGAKTRKIEGLLGHLKDRGYDELITFAGNITNLGFDITPLLAREGIRGTLLVVDDPPMAAADRERHFAGILDDIQLLGPGRVGAARIAAQAYRQARREGRRALVVAPGIGHPSAVVGNIRGLLELAERDSLPGTIFVSVATGNTLAGFLLGVGLLRAQGHPPVRIVGVQVYPGQIPLLTRGLLAWTRRFLGARGLPVPRLELVTSEVAGGFGAYPDRLVEVCERVAQRNGIAIDPIFGGKTWSVMEAMRAGGEVTGECMFWHCGYTPEWRDLRPASAGVDEGGMG